jgi:FkbM family methyltransferase
MSETTISQRMIRKFNKRCAELQMRFNGTYWRKIKNAENALLLYEEQDTSNFKQKKWLINYFKKVIIYHKFSFFLSKTITRIFYPPKSIRLQLSSDTSGNLSEQKNSLVFKDIYIPLPINKIEEDRFNADFLDIIFPYLVNEAKIAVPIQSLVNPTEGPYELDENICLRENDIVIDCGANIGVFSALAAAKGCVVYSFEPFPYIVQNYLSKTASWNKNINICQYALWDSENILAFEANYEDIGISSLVKTSRAGKKIEIQAIKLDNFAHSKNLSKIDFIKADIEGAERNMLRGAKEVLKEFAPKLSICIYHLPDDPQVIRELILDANPNYKIKEEFNKIYAYVPVR